MSADGKNEEKEVVDPVNDSDGTIATATDENNEQEGFEGIDLERLKAQASKAKEHWDRLVRTTADFDNFKKRALRERQDATKFANESLITNLLPILDNFEAALTATTSGDAKAMESLQTGISMVYQQLRKTLTDAGLEEIDATNQPFDPNIHEAVSQQASKDVPEGHVLQQLRKGYKLRERLLRPASVVVAKRPSSQEKI